MEKLLLELLEESKKNKKTLNKLKSLSVEFGLFELAAQLRQIEIDLFPDKEEQVHAKSLSLAFRMVGLNIDAEHCFMINETIIAFNDMNSDFSLKDAAKIIAKKEELF